MRSKSSWRSGAKNESRDPKNDEHTQKERGEVKVLKRAWVSIGFTTLSATPLPIFHCHLCIPRPASGLYVCQLVRIRREAALDFLAARLARLKNQGFKSCSHSRDSKTEIAASISYLGIIGVSFASVSSGMSPLPWRMKYHRMLVTHRCRCHGTLQCRGA